MAVVGLIVHLGRSEAAAHARDLAAWLVAEGHGVRVPPDDAAVSGLGAHRVDVDAFAGGLDLVVTLGGDGNVEFLVHARRGASPGDIDLLVAAALAEVDAP